MALICFEVLLSSRIVTEWRTTFSLLNAIQCVKFLKSFDFRMHLEQLFKLLSIIDSHMRETAEKQLHDAAKLILAN